MKNMVIGMAAGAALLASLPALAQDSTPCQQMIGFTLSELGIKMADMTQTTMKTQRWQHPGGEGPISGYVFAAKPPACTSGALVIALSNSCQVNQMYTTGGCSVKGVSSWGG